MTPEEWTASKHRMRVHAKMIDELRATMRFQARCQCNRYASPWVASRDKAKTLWTRHFNRKLWKEIEFRAKRR